MSIVTHKGSAPDYLARRRLALISLLTGDNMTAGIIDEESWLEESQEPGHSPNKICGYKFNRRVNPCFWHPWDFHTVLIANRVTKLLQSEPNKLYIEYSYAYISVHSSCQEKGHSCKTVFESFSSASGASQLFL